MRRKVSIIGILLLALCVSGWSGALAATLSCPHAKGEQPRVMMIEQSHSCCRAKLAQDDEKAAAAQEETHCSTKEPQAMSEARMRPLAEAFAEAVAQPAGSCAHCIDRSEVPATPTFREANPLKRNADSAATSRKVRPPAPFVDLFAPQVLYRQGSPPGVRARRHLLMSVFII